MSCMATILRSTQPHNPASCYCAEGCCAAAVQMQRWQQVRPPLGGSGGGDFSRLIRGGRAGPFRKNTVPFTNCWSSGQEEAGPGPSERKTALSMEISPLRTPYCSLTQLLYLNVRIASYHVPQSLKHHLEAVLAPARIHHHRNLHSAQFS